MNRAVLATACALFLAGGSIFAHKHWQLGMALAPDSSARVWQIDFAITLAGDGRLARIELVLPASTPRQVILDEETFDDGLAYIEEARPGTRKGRWLGPVGDVRELVYSVRVHVPEAAEQNGDFAGLGTSPNQKPSGAAPKSTIPPGELTEMLGRLRVSKDDDPNAALATIFGFVVYEIDSVSNGSHDPRVVLRAREGSAEGKTRLMLELLQAAGVSARLGAGVRLHRAGSSEIEHFVETQIEGRTLRLLVSAESPDRFPENFLSLSTTEVPTLVSRGLLGTDLRVVTLRESLPADEMASSVAPESALVRAVSLYRLPISTRAVLRTLLVLPLAVLIAAIYRNLVGIRTFGTFMPVLIALSLRETGLAAGIALITGCLTAGVVGRLLLDRLRLLFVPRVCLLLCIVILSITVLAMLGHTWGVRDLASGLLFPIIILALLIERISVTTLEEGWRASALLLLGSLGLTALSYPIFQSEAIGHLFLGFPELVLCVMASLVLVGGYTGYRLSELWRFRSLTDEDAPPPTTPTTPTSSSEAATR